MRHITDTSTQGITDTAGAVQRGAEKSKDAAARTAEKSKEACAGPASAVRSPGPCARVWALVRHG